MREKFGQEPDANIVFISGDYNAGIVTGQILIDDNSGERFAILGADGQRAFNAANQHHVALVAVEQQRTGAEA